MRRRTRAPSRPACFFAAIGSDCSRGLRAEIELPRDLPLRMTPRDEPEHLPLTGRELLRAGAPALG